MNKVRCYDVFISYRRKTGVNDARLLQQALRVRGYNVFFDFDSLRDGKFNARILHAIDEAKVFILMLTDGSLDQCLDEGDWVRLEIAHAIKAGKKIVPIKPSDQFFEFPVVLPHEMESIRNEQFSELNKGALFEESVNKIIRDRFPSDIKSKPQRRNRYLRMTMAAVLLSALFMSWYSLRDKDGPARGDPTGQDNEKKTFEDGDKAPLFIFDYKGDVDGVVLNGNSDIIIPQGVRRINRQAITNCAITSVRFPDSLEEIGYRAFADCRLLTNVTFGIGLKKMSDCAFADCHSLSGVFEFPEGLESLGRALVFCQSKITDVVLPSTLRKMEWQEFICSSSSLKRIWFKGNAPNIPDEPTSAKYKYEQSPLYGAPQGIVILVPKDSTGWKNDSTGLPYLWPTNSALKPGARKIVNYSGHPPQGTSGVVSHLLGRKAVSLPQTVKKRPGPSNDEYANPKELTGQEGREVGSNVDATSNSGEFLDGIFGSEHTLWYRWIAPSNGVVTFDTSGSDFDTVMGVLMCVGTDGAARSITANDDAGEGATLTSRMTFQVESGREYRISVGGKHGASGNVNLNWKVQLKD